MKLKKKFDLNYSRFMNSAGNMEVRTMRKIGFLFSLLVAWSLVGGSFADSVQTKRRNPVHDLIRVLEVGKPVNYGKLTVLPVFSVKIKDKTKYVTLEDALKYNR